MSTAVELIVDGYVRLGDRTSLTKLKAHREHLLAQLRGQLGGWFDVSRSIGQMEEEISRIDAGLVRLDGALTPLSATTTATSGTRVKWEPPVVS